MAEPLKSILAETAQHKGRGQEREGKAGQENIQIRATAWSQELYFDCQVFTDSPKCWKGDNSLQSVLPHQLSVQFHETKSQNASRIPPERSSCFSSSPLWSSCSLYKNPSTCQTSTGAQPVHKIQKTSNSNQKLGSFLVFWCTSKAQGWVGVFLAGVRP